MKRVLYILSIMLLMLNGNALWAQDFQQADAYVYSFPEAENRLLADYADNAGELQRMAEQLRQNRIALLEGTSHLLIVVHLASWQYMETEAVNEASIRAARIRNYLKTKLKLPHECIVFYIDRSGLDRDQVHLYYLDSPVPWFANQEICYSESRYSRSMEEAVGKYGAIPFVEQYKRMSGEQKERIVYMICDALFDKDEVSDYRLLISKKTSLSQTVKPKKQVERPHEKEVMPEEVKPETAHATVVTTSFSGARPFNLSIKTNLLPWCTLAPSVMLGNGPVEFNKGSFMPNLELEYCFGECWSVDASFLYSYYTYNGNPDNLWGVSSVTLEPRFWLKGDGRFRWLWVGAFGQYGDFDVRGEKISSDGLYGRTGKFASGGLAIGCMIPLGAGFCMEAALQGGYRSVFGGEKYRYDKVDDKNYQESLFNATGMMIGFRLSIVYRIGIW
ncbi:DUF3575 domain-containing protein [Parabacteroides faecis]|uniref:DUF3575 domain-containing protein n=1 Tax=Parabacteroides TaxID=375288 RepID=UPI001314668A|nr:MULTISPECIES: DUF3575 domain-containing protein [Parabacteroides]MBC8617345.1 DUF3575 domain-containing protein [Parabacteroides faecis]